MVSMSASEMAMTFFSSITTPLYSSEWAPSSRGQYAGTCIFLIVLGFIFRAFLALKHEMEHKWRQQALQRRYIVVADKPRLAEELREKDESKTAVLTVRGVEEEVKVAHAPVAGVQPWRFTVDLPRAALVTAIAGVGYLMMLAVMTLNVGYFLSVLGGVFLGEATWGRYNNPLESEH